MEKSSASPLIGGVTYPGTAAGYVGRAGRGRTSGLLNFLRVRIDTEVGAHGVLWRIPSPHTPSNKCTHTYPGPIGPDDSGAAAGQARVRPFFVVSLLYFQMHDDVDGAGAWFSFNSFS